MTDPVVRPVAPVELDALVPLIGAYQEFYGARRPDPERNRAFFARFLRPSDAGELLGAWRGDALAGYACLYWSFSSVSASERVVLNDLFVAPVERGTGVGRSLIDAAHGIARERGAAALAWSTALDNRVAQRLYDTYPAARTSWFEYELPTR